MGTRGGCSTLFEGHVVGRLMCDRPQHHVRLTCALSRLPATILQDPMLLAQNTTPPRLSPCSTTLKASELLTWAVER